MTRLGKLAELAGGELSAGADPDLEISGASTLKDSRPGQVTFINHPRYKSQLAESPASAAIVPLGFELQKKPTISVSDVDVAFIRLIKHFRPPHVRQPVGISPQAFISDSAVIGDSVNIYPGVYVGDGAVIGDNCTLLPNCCVMERSTIGDNVTIHPCAVIYEGCEIGDDSIIHSGAAIGSYGFGYKMDESTHQLKLCSQLGNVILGNRVEVGSNSAIDRASYGSTTVGQGSKIDNIVQIAHNCEIGDHVLLCAQVGIAGSSSVGNHTILAGQVGVIDHVDICENVQCGAQSKVAQSVTKPGAYEGTPIDSIRETLQRYIHIRKLPALKKQVKQLEKRINELESEMVTRRDNAAA